MITIQHIDWKYKVDYVSTETATDDEGTQAPLEHIENIVSTEEEAIEIAHNIITPKGLDEVINFI